MRSITPYGPGFLFVLQQCFHIQLQSNRNNTKPAKVTRHFGHFYVLNLWPFPRLFLREGQGLKKVGLGKYSPQAILSLEKKPESGNRIAAFS